jgi:flagellar hook-associated protein 2
MAIGLNPSTILSGDGIDVATLVQQILADQKAGPLQEWQSEQTTLSSQAGLLLGINNNLTNLATAVTALSDPIGPLAALTASSSQPGVLTATAQSSAIAGTHQISVTNLVSTSTAYTDVVPGGTLSAGGFTLQVGSGATATVPTSAGETLTQLANYINGQNLGVSASVISDANGSRLSLLSQTAGQPGNLTVVPVGGAGTPSYTGAGNGTISGLTGGSASVAETFTIAATDATHFSVTGSISGAIGTATAGTAFSSNQIGFTIASGATPFQAGDTFTVSTTAPTLNFHQVAGNNASLNVDGVPVSSSSNTVTGVIPGVTLNLLGAPSSGSLRLTVGPNTAQATQAINNFVSAYNAIIGNINQQYVVDPTTNNEGPLGSDFFLRSLQSSLLSDVSYSITGNSGLVNLASLGINLNNDGTLTVNNVSTPTDPSLADVLASNPGAVQSFFQNAQQTGFADHFHGDLSALTSPSQGILNVDIAQNSATQQALTKSISDFQLQLTAQQQQLTKQFNQVNANLQAYPLLLQQVTEIIGSLGGQSGSGSTATPILTKGL